MLWCIFRGFPCGFFGLGLGIVRHFWFYLLWLVFFFVLYFFLVVLVMEASLPVGGSPGGFSLFYLCFVHSFVSLQKSESAFLSFTLDLVLGLVGFGFFWGMFCVILDPCRHHNVFVVVGCFGRCAV